MPKIWTWAAVHLSSIIASSFRRKAPRKGPTRSGLLGTIGISDGGLPGLVTAVAIDVVLIAMSLDMCYRAHWLHAARDLSFSRTGFVSDITASLVLRTRTPSFNLTYVSLGGSAEVGMDIPADSDSTVTVRLDGLQPDSLYDYTSTAGHKGSFQTSLSDPTTFSLVSTSCQKPNWPYNPANHPLRITEFGISG